MSSDSPPLSLRRKALLLSGSIAAALLIAELAMRIASPITGFYPQLYLRPNRRLHFIWQPPIRGVAPDGFYTTDSWGFRGDEPPKDWNDYATILTIGGSTTECAVLDDHKTWPYVLQQELRKKIPRAWVGNAGASGETTSGHLIIVEQVVPRIRPQTALFLVGINDLGRSFLGEDKTGTWEDWTGWRNSVIAYSRVLQFLHRSYKTHFGVRLMHQALNFTERPLRDPAPIPNDLRSALPSLGPFRDNLKNIILRCRKLGVRPVFMTQPLLFDGSRRWRNAESGFNWVHGRAISAADFWRMLDAFNQELLRICKEERAECLDLAARIPHSQEFFYDNVHLNETGARRVGSEIARYLLEESPRPLAPELGEAGEH